MTAQEAYQLYLQELAHRKAYKARRAGFSDHVAMGAIWDIETQGKQLTYNDVGGEGHYDRTRRTKINYDFRKHRNTEYKYETRMANGDLVRVY